MLMFYMIGIILETMLLIAWDKLILQKELPNFNLIVLKSINLLFSHRLLFVKSILGSVAWKKDDEQVLEFIKVVKDILISAIFGLIFFLFLPLSYTIFSSLDISTLSKIIILAAFITSFYTKLKLSTAYIIKLGKEAHNILSNWDFYAFLLKEKMVLNKIVISKKRIFIIAPFLLVIYMLIWGIFRYYNFLQHNVFVIIIAIFLLFYVLIISPLIDRMHKKSEYENKEHNVDVEGVYFYKFTNYIDEICNCKKLGIRDVLFTVEASKKSEAYAVVKKFEQPKIVFTDGFFEEAKDIYGDTSNYNDVVKLFIGHELIHVSFQDKPSLINRVRLGAIIGMLYFLICLGLSLFFAISNVDIILTIISVCLLLTSPSLVKTIRDPRYWNQVSELRADRLGLRYSGVDFKIFEDFFDASGRIKNEQDFSKKLNNSNLFYRYYKRYSENEDHPCLKKRIRSIMKQSDWGLDDYLQHVFTVTIWRVTGRGWNGR